MEIEEPNIEDLKKFRQQIQSEEQNISNQLSNF